jgi:hypothetical protein
MGPSPAQMPGVPGVALMTIRSDKSYLKRAVSSTIDGIRRAGIWIYLGIRSAISEMQELLPSATRDIRYSLWFRWKRWQSYCRKSLSHDLAAFLALLVLIRERHELWRIVSTCSRPKYPELLILIITGLTFGAAWFERFGNKMAASPLEARFQEGLRELFDRLHSLARARDGAEVLDKQFDEFSTFLVGVAAQTFSIKSQVDVGLMVKLPDKDRLKLVKWSARANYDRKLEVALPQGATYDESGPAGIAHEMKLLVYTPKKERNPKESWAFRYSQTGRDFEFNYDQIGDPRPHWKKAEKEDFSSVICVVIDDVGVLNFSTKMRDPFIDRDFSMAEHYGKMLSIAAEIHRNKIPI